MLGREVLGRTSAVTRTCLLGGLAVVGPGSFHSALAAAPQQAPAVELTMEGRLTDAAGLPIDQALPVEVTVYDDALAGAVTFREAHPGVPFANGYYAIAVGTGALVAGSLEDALRDNERLWMTVNVNGDGEMTPRIPVRAAPLSINSRMLAGSTYDKASGAPTGNGREGDLYLDVDADELYVNTDGATAWNPIGGGVGTFLELSDTPATFGSPGLFLQVNAGGNGLEFVPAPGGIGQLQIGAGPDSLVGGISLNPPPTASGDSAIGMGPGASASGFAGIAVGLGASANDSRSVAIGQSASAEPASGVGRQVAVGFGSSAEGQYTVAIGSIATAGDQGAIAIGEDALAASEDSIAIGSDSNAANEGAIAIGARPNNPGGSTAAGFASIAIGTSAFADASATLSIVMGSGSTALSPNSVAVGESSTASGNRSVALGMRSEASGANAIALGNGSPAGPGGTVASGSESLAVGTNALASSSLSAAFGPRASATAGRALAIGDRAAGAGENSIAIGREPTAQGENTIAIGEAATALGDHSIAIGLNCEAQGIHSIAVGRDLTVTENNVARIGRLGAGLYAERKVGLFPGGGALTDVESNKVCTNEGAAALSVIDLPPARAGLSYTFIVRDTPGLRIQVAGGDTIRIGATTGPTAESTTIGDTLTIVAVDSVRWFATSVVGTGWTQ